MMNFCDDENVIYLDYINISVLVETLCIVLQDVTQNLSVVFIIPHVNLQLSPNKKYYNK